MPGFRNFKELEKHLKKATNKVLENDVADAIKQQQSETIEREVYNAYSPIEYNRRGSTGGGYGDIRNIDSSMSDGYLVITNTTPPNPNYNSSRLGSRSLGESIERGFWYNYWRDAFPRPAIRETKNDLEQNKRHIHAFKRGLKKQGIRTD